MLRGHLRLRYKAHIFDSLRSFLLFPILYRPESLLLLFHGDLSLLLFLRSHLRQDQTKLFQMRSNRQALCIQEQIQRQCVRSAQGPDVFAFYKKGYLLVSGILCHFDDMQDAQ